MNFLIDLIPAQYRVAAEAALCIAALVCAAVCGAIVMHWHDNAQLQTERAGWANERTEAVNKTNAALAAAIKDRDALAGRLAKIDATSLDNLRRFEHANQDLAARADAGSVRVRVVGATCPAAHDVPQAAAGGSVDPGAGAELGPDARRRYFAFRSAAGHVQEQLAACQAVVRCFTGQGTCASQ